MMPAPVRAALERVVSLLVAGRFDELERLDRGGRMKADEWRRRVKEYGRTLVQPPRADLETADIVPLQGSGNRAWSVRYPLWTREEAKSDLSVELTVRYNGGDDVDIEIDDLRVA
jgi:hypothetical protein